MRLENKTCVIVEIAGKARGKMESCGIEPLHDDKPKPFVETVEDGGKIEVRAGGKRAQLRGSVIRVALHAQELLDDRALFRGKSRARPECRLFKETIGDLSWAAAAGRGYARDGEKVFDKCACALLIGAFENAKDAGMIGAVQAWAQDRVEGFALRMATRDAATPLGRKFERFEKPGKQPGVADPHDEARRGSLALFGDACRFEREGEDFRVRRLPVRPAKTLNSGLRKFVLAAWEKPKNRPAIGEACALASTLRGEIGGQDRNRIFRTQAIVGAGKIAREIELAAQLLAGIEKDRSRLQDRRFTARVSGTGEMGDDAFGALIGK